MRSTEEDRAWDRAVAETLDAQRSAAGLTQDQAADIGGVSRASYLRYENGYRPAPSEVVFRLTRHYGMPVSDFYRLVEDHYNRVGVPALLARSVKGLSKAQQAELAAAIESHPPNEDI